MLITSFTVLRGNVPLDTTTTQQWGTEELALAKAKEIRDRRDTAAPCLAPCHIRRTTRRSTARQL